MSSHARAIGAHTHRRPHLAAARTESADRRPRSAGVALYSAGMVIGFLLAALASAPGGGTVVAWQLACAAVAGGVCLLAAARARAARRMRSHTPGGASRVHHDRTVLRRAA